WIQTGIAELYELLPDFGQVLALDGKIIDSYAVPNGRKKKKDRAPLKTRSIASYKKEGTLALQFPARVPVFPTFLSRLSGEF
ncbi:hypothetical protein HZZ02_24530, partial [Streptococcus danieliae]|nr:hypothetical protein [Streptococcus danieliae]